MSSQRALSFPVLVPNTGKPSLVVRPNESRTTITMLETKNVTIHAVGSASSHPHRDVRCADREARFATAASAAISAGLHFGPRRRAALGLLGTEEAEDVLVLQVGDLD